MRLSLFLWNPVVKCVLCPLWKPVLLHCKTCFDVKPIDCLVHEAFSINTAAKTSQSLQLIQRQNVVLPGECLSCLPQHVTVPLDLLEPLPVPHGSDFSNLPNPPPPVQEAVVKVYVVHFLMWSNLKVTKQSTVGLLSALDYLKEEIKVYQ